MPVEKSDKRRRQFVPLVTTFAHGRTAEALIRKFGRDGLLVWVCYLAACKRAPEQGVFEYVSEGEGWGLLGLRGIEPDFTLTDFFRATGQLHKTSRRTRGQLTTVACTVWGDITSGYDRELDAARKRRKRGTNTPDTERTEDGQPEDDPRTVGEGEGEGEGVRANALAARRVFEHWQKVWNHPRTDYSPERERLIRSRLKTYGEDKLVAAIDGSKLDALRWPERAALPAHKLSVVLKDADHIEGFVALTASPSSPNGVHTETEEDRERRLLAQLNQLGPKEAA